jgi:hypothetical protein
MHTFVIVISVYLALQVVARLIIVAGELKIGEPTVSTMATQIFVKTILLIWACVLIFS